MLDGNLMIYALSGVVVVLSLVLSTRVVKRRLNKPKNIWANFADSPVKSQFQAPNRYPMTPPAPHLFSHR